MTLRTVTLSPGFDHLVTIDRHDAGGVAKVLSWTELASGKGVNVARTATALGVECVAYSLVGTQDADDFRLRLARDGVRAELVEVAGPTRRNLTLRVLSDAAPAAHAVGPRLRADGSDAEELIARLLSHLQPGDFVTFNGAVAEGVPTDIWARASVAVRGRGGTVMADVQDQPLRELIEKGAVWMAKPNIDEARVFFDSPAQGRSVIEDAVIAIKAMHQQGVEVPVITLGAEGVLSTKDGFVIHSACPVGNVQVVVGAGDAFLAGYCAALTVGGWRKADPVLLGLAVAAAHVAGQPPTDVAGAVRLCLASVEQQSIGTL